MITFAAVLLPIAILGYVQDLYKSETYNAKVVDFVYETREKTKTHKHSSSSRTITVKLPIVQFVANQGDTITKKAEHYNTLYSYKEKAMYCKVDYNPSTGNVFIVDRSGFYKMLSVMIFFAAFFDFLFVGLLLYVLGKDMTRYKRMLIIVLFFISIPIAILSFAIVLLVTAYEATDLSLPAQIACYVFGTLLLLAFTGYVKLLSKNKNKKSHHDRHRSHPSFLEFRK
ncbi:hypothetical protein RCZ04_21880 [Capnocytophaga sp. HP1101]